MEKDIFFAVLKTCYKKGINNATDITPHFRKAIANVADSKPVNWRDLPDLIFSDFKELEYIHYIVAIDYSKEKEDIPENWLELINVSGMIKPKGLLFYNSWNQSKIQETANKVSIGNIFLTLLISFGVFLVALFTFNKSDEADEDRANLRAQIHKVDSLKKQLSQLKSRLSKEQERTSDPSGLHSVQPPSSSNSASSTVGKNKNATTVKK